MKHRIAAGVLVAEGDRLSLVRHQKPGVYDFRVAPGGGAEGPEDLRETARREVAEPCRNDGQDHLAARLAGRILARQRGWILHAKVSRCS